jgi:probable F420-dependent oxidoreductase
VKIGVVFPQTEYGSDPAAIRDYAQTAEALGYSHILAYDHVLGANPEREGGWSGPYTFQDPFQEPFVLFSFMAAVTGQIEFTTGILILPQRQTALVAKQAATLDVLSGGRLRLGVGIGWNQVEYVALNESFHNRGRRIEEQIALLRRLWMEPLVSFEGQWHTVPDAGLNPLPVQRPIPIWFGGRADSVLRRVVRLGDGWMPDYRTAAAARPALDKIAAYLAEADRDPASLGLEARLLYGDGDADAWFQQMDEWQTAGTTHLSLNTMRCGLATATEHLAAIRHFAESLGLG